MTRLKDIKVGDLVVVARWADFDLMDATALGEFLEYKDGYFYISIQGVPQTRGYNHCRVVEKRKVVKPHILKNKTVVK